LDEQLKLSAENTETSLKLSQNDSRKLKNASSAKLKSSKAKSVMSFSGEELPSFNTIKQFQGSHILSSLSKAICLTSAILDKKQPFMHIRQLNQINPNDVKLFSLPKPLVTILQNGKGFNGKQTLIKEFILIPKSNISMKEAFDLMSKIQRSIRDTLYQSKQMPGVGFDRYVDLDQILILYIFLQSINKCLTDIGSLQCTLDTPQNGIDIIESAIQAICGEDHLSKFNIGLNINAQELFDQVSEIFLTILKKT
jgi:enolase